MKDEYVDIKISPKLLRELKILKIDLDLNSYEKVIARMIYILKVRRWLK